MNNIFNYYEELISKNIMTEIHHLCSKLNEDDEKEFYQLFKDLKKMDVIYDAEKLNYH
jgi:hypothetical protein